MHLNEMNGRFVLKKNSSTRATCSGDVFQRICELLNFKSLHETCEKHIFKKIQHKYSNAEMDVNLINVFLLLIYLKGFESVIRS